MWIENHMQKEIDELTSEINRIKNATEFNTMKLLNGELASIVTSTDQVLSSGTYNNEYASKVTGTTGNLNKYIDGGIVISAGGTFASSLSPSITGAESIQIDVTTAGLDISIVTGTAGGTSSTYSDSITLDSAGGYTYNNHGVSFSIKATDISHLSAGESVSVGGFTAGTTGNVDLVSTYTYSGLAANHPDLGDIAVVAMNDNHNVRSMTVDWLGNASTTGGTLQVELIDSAGTTLMNDSISISALGSYTYDNHGITFYL
jgi:flagellin